MRKVAVMGVMAAEIGLGSTILGPVVVSSFGAALRFKFVSSVDSCDESFPPLFRSLLGLGPPLVIRKEPNSMTPNCLYSNLLGVTALTLPGSGSLGRTEMTSRPGSKDVFLECRVVEARFELECRANSEREGARVATPGVRIIDR